MTMRNSTNTAKPKPKKPGRLEKLRKSYYELVDMFKGDDFFSGWMILMFIMIATIAAIIGIGIVLLLAVALFTIMPKWVSIPLACVIIVPFCFGIVARYFIPSKESIQ